MIDFKFENKIKVIKKLIIELEKARANAITYELEADQEAFEYQINLAIKIKNELKELIK